MKSSRARALLPAIVLLALNGCAHTDPLPDDGFVAAARPVVTYNQVGSANSDRMPNLECDAVLSRFVAE